MKFRPEINSFQFYIKRCTHPIQQAILFLEYFISTFLLSRFKVGPGLQLPSRNSSLSLSQISMPRIRFHLIFVTRILAIKNCTVHLYLNYHQIDWFLTKTYEHELQFVRMLKYSFFLPFKSSQFSQIFIDGIEIVVSRAVCHSLSYTRWPDVTTEEGEEEGGRMSRTTHDATVHSGERFGGEEAANCRVIVERHLAHFQLRIHPDLKNIDLDQSLLRNRCLRETETETEGRE